MLAVQRTHRLRDDRTWMPASVRRSRSLVAGTLWAGTSVALVASAVFAPATLLLWKAIAIGAAGIAVAGERAGKAVLQRKITRLSRGEIDLAAVHGRAEGDLVVVTGVIEAEAPLRGVLIDATGVYRRLVLAARGKWVHEAAIDFSLIDDAGHRILIQAAGARWIIADRELVRYPAHKFVDAERVPERIRALAAGHDAIDASERVLPVGARVQIVGYKTASPDATGEATDYRTAPTRATLTSGPELPLVITLAPPRS